MAKKKTPVLSFTKEEADYIKARAVRQLAYFKEADKIEPEIFPEDTIAKSLADMTIGMRLPSSEIEKMKLGNIKKNKGIELFIENPDFIFGKEGLEYFELLNEFYFNLLLSNDKKKNKIIPKILKKVGIRLDQFPEEHIPIGLRIYFDGF